MPSGGASRLTGSSTKVASSPEGVTRAPISCTHAATTSALSCAPTTRSPARTAARRNVPCGALTEKTTGLSDTVASSGPRAFTAPARRASLELTSPPSSSKPTPESRRPSASSTSGRAVTTFAPSSARSSSVRACVRRPDHTASRRFSTTARSLTMATTPKPESPADGSTTNKMSSVKVRRNDRNSEVGGAAICADSYMGCARVCTAPRVAPREASGIWCRRALIRRLVHRHATCKVAARCGLYRRGAAGGARWSHDFSDRGVRVSPEAGMMFGLFFPRGTT